MDVSIVERSTGKVVAIYPVSFQGLNYVPSDQEYFDLAWRSAVDDGVVEENKSEDYEFKKGE